MRREVADGSGKEIVVQPRHLGVPFWGVGRNLLANRRA